MIRLVYGSAAAGETSSSISITAAASGIRYHFSPENITSMLSQLPEFQAFKPEFYQSTDGAFIFAVGDKCYHIKLI